MYNEWMKIGGGCRITSKITYPCDDQFEHRKTGEKVIVRSTRERHFKMPTGAHTIAELHVLVGVEPEAQSDE